MGSFVGSVFVVGSFVASVVASVVASIDSEVVYAGFSSVISVYSTVSGGFDVFWGLSSVKYCSSLSST